MINIFNEKVKNIKYELLSVSFIILFITLFFIFIYGLNSTNINYPWSYDGGDASWIYGYAQNILDSGWSLSNNRLAAPFSFELHDYSAVVIESYQFLLMKFISLFTNNIYLIINILYILNCISICIFSFLVFRNLRINHFIAIFSSLTFSLLPYFFTRYGHFFLANYQIIPLGILLCIWCYNDESFFNINKTFFKNYKNVIGILCCVLISMNNVYYSFFICFFLVVTSLICSNFKLNKKLLPALSLILLISICLLINLLPHFIYRINNGSNFAVNPSNFIDVELYGLKIIQLFMPIHSRGINILGKVMNKYNGTGFLINENSTAFLGILGSLGCLYLIICLFKNNQNNSINKNINLLSRLNIAGILLGTIGGFSSLFALIVSPLIRCYNRISVFIAFICICAISLLINEIYIKLRFKIIYKQIFLGFICLILFLGILFQYPYSIKQKALNQVHTSIYPTFTSDSKFIQEIETILPEGSMVYQFPYMNVPGHSGPQYNMNVYRLLYGLLHSKELRWSYGYVRGRYQDNWHKRVYDYPLINKLIILSLIGFEGIYIDRRAYTENEIIELELSLQEILKTELKYSDDNLLSFLNMNKFNKNIHSQISNEELLILKNELLNNIEDEEFIYSELLKFNELKYYFYKNYFLEYKNNIGLINNKSIYQLSGWSSPENWGTWTDGEESVLAFSVENNNDLLLNFNTLMIINENPVDIYINNKYLDTINIINGENSIKIPNEYFPDNILIVKFLFKDVKTPIERGINQDLRKLNIGLTSFSILEDK